MKTKSFMDMIEDQIGSSVTENGAVGYASSGHALVDLNFAVSSLRNRSDTDVVQMFEAAYKEDPQLAIVWLFFARDIRGGMGERRLFRLCMDWLADQHTDVAKHLLPLIPYYGRWDDAVELIGTALHHDVLRMIRDQLFLEMHSEKDEEISLLSKWLPSECSRTPRKKRQALTIMQFLGMSPRAYRQTLSALRKRLDVVERKMSAGEWEAIRYPAVPSRANLIYNDAFLRHDEVRRREFLAKVRRGELKINASTLYPHDIVHQYGHADFVDPTLEALWNALPNTVPKGGSTIVVADGSGSMTSRIGKTNVTALSVANALAIYFAERLPKPFRNKYITFSMNPQFVDLSGCPDLCHKILTARRYNEVANTNVKAVFDLLRHTAVDNHLKQEEIPSNILILSDMEFDDCVKGGALSRQQGPWGAIYMQAQQFTAPLFKQIEEEWKQDGYKLPRLIFWNICSRTNTIPVKQNEMGVALVSGFSPNIAEMVMGAELDPMTALLKVLYGDRYTPVRIALDMQAH